MMTTIRMPKLRALRHALAALVRGLLCGEPRLSAFSLPLALGRTHGGGKLPGTALWAVFAVQERMKRAGRSGWCGSAWGGFGE